MADDLDTPPETNEIEVSLFGPGYGEAIALHLGSNKWLLVDSCTVPGSDTPLHLQYVKDLGIDPSTSVVHIVISHWHDDHVRGVSAVVRECSAANVTLSNALREDEFLALASIYDSRPIPGGSGIDELVAVLRYLRESRRAVPIFATVDRTLYQQALTFQGATVQATVFAVSPSDAATYQSKVAFALSYPTEGAKPTRIESVTPNQASVAILVEIGMDILLLGSDLEACADVASGWSAVLTSVTVAGRVAKVFKVPHHGGQSAHDGRVWTNLLGNSPYAILTPFIRGRWTLPSGTDKTRITQLTPNAFVTGLPKTRRFRPDERVVADMMEDAATSVVEVVTAPGQIRLRKKPNELDWTVELFGGAQALA